VTVESEIPHRHWLKPRLAQQFTTLSDAASHNGLWPQNHYCVPKGELDYGLTSATGDCGPRFVEVGLLLVQVSLGIDYGQAREGVLMSGADATHLLTAAWYEAIVSRFHNPSGQSGE
jgi:hypothetical protein